MSRLSQGDAREDRMVPLESRPNVGAAMVARGRIRITPQANDRVIIMVFSCYTSSRAVQEHDKLFRWLLN